MIRMATNIWIGGRKSRSFVCALTDFSAKSLLGKKEARTVIEAGVAIIACNFKRRVS